MSKISLTAYLVLFSLTVLNSFNIFSQSGIDKEKYAIKKVNEHTYIFTEIWNSSNNANMGFVIGNDGVLLINTLMTNSAKDLESEIKKITDKPIKYVINSDSDVFNYHANKYFSDKGAVIISHENLKYATPHTNILFSESISIPVGDEIVTAYHTKAHTLDHIDIHLEKSNVIFMGDGFKGYWLTYFGPNGTKGVIEGIDRALEIANDKTIIVSGNTSKNKENYLNDTSDLIRNKKIYSNFSKRIGYLYNKGKSIEEISKDQELHNIVEPLELYEKVKNHLTAFIAHVIEVDYLKGYKLKKHKLDDFAGLYRLDDKNSIEIVSKNGKLYAKEHGKFIFELKAIDENKFDFNGNTGFRGTSNREDYLEFQFNANGTIKSLRPILKKDNWWVNVITTGTYINLNNSN